MTAARRLRNSLANPATAPIFSYPRWPPAEARV